ncbi:MAG: DUF502 domain-containing protein [Pseudomonadota bacterium]
MAGSNSTDPNPEEGQQGRAARANDPLIKASKPSLLGRLRANFLAGIVVAAPIGITVAIILWFLNGPLKRVDTFVKGWLPDSGSDVDTVLEAIPFFGVLVAILGLIILGAMARNFIGSTLIRAGENIVESMPVVRNLYRFLKNVFETALQQSDRSFKEVALVEYPSKGLWVMAFVVGSAKGEILEQLDDQGTDLTSIFIPTVPNPTSGFLIFVPRASLRVLDMTVEEAAKTVFSMGLVVPERQSPEDAVAALERLASEAASEEIDGAKASGWFKRKKTSVK